MEKSGSARSDFYVFNCSDFYALSRLPTIALPRIEFNDDLFVFGFPARLEIANFFQHFGLDRELNDHRCSS